MLLPTLLTSQGANLFKGLLHVALSVIQNVPGSRGRMMSGLFQHFLLYMGACQTWFTGLVLQCKPKANKTATKPS